TCPTRPTIRRCPESLSACNRLATATGDAANRFRGARRGVPRCPSRAPRGRGPPSAALARVRAGDQSLTGVSTTPAPPSCGSPTLALSRRRASDGDPLMNDPYPVRLTIDYPDRPLTRLSSALRISTLLPLAIVLAAIGGFGHTYVGGTGLLFLPTLLLIVFRRKYPRWWF